MKTVLLLLFIVISNGSDAQISISAGIGRLSESNWGIKSHITSVQTRRNRYTNDYYYLNFERKKERTAFNCTLGLLTKKDVPYSKYYDHTTGGGSMPFYNVNTTFSANVDYTYLMAKWGFGRHFQLKQHVFKNGQQSFFIGWMVRNDIRIRSNSYNFQYTSVGSNNNNAQQQMQFYTIEENQNPFETFKLVPICLAISPRFAPRFSLGNVYFQFDLMAGIQFGPRTRKPSKAYEGNKERHSLLFLDTGCSVGWTFHSKPTSSPRPDLHH